MPIVSQMSAFKGKAEKCACAQLFSQKLERLFERFDTAAKMEWDWDFRSVARSSKLMEDGLGRKGTITRRSFSLRYPAGQRDQRTSGQARMRSPDRLRWSSIGADRNRRKRRCRTGAAILEQGSAERSLLSTSGQAAHRQAA
jgi:hypothetical protein